MAQTTIFYTPTTDTLAKGKFYAEFDYLPQAPRAEHFQADIYEVRLIAGALGNLEFGLNFPIFNLKASGDSSNYAYIQPDAKYRFYNNDKRGVAIAAGILWNAPLNSRNIQDDWGLLYGTVSKKIKAGDYGPRFHAGVYGIVSANQDPQKGPVSFFGPRAGASLGYEQPVQKKISIVADWFSGKNNVGYFTPGVLITLPKNGALSLGYSFGNDSWANSNAAKNRYVFLSCGITF